MLGLLSLLWIPIYNSFDAKPLDTLSQAEIVGEQISRKIFPDIDYRQYEVQSEFDSISNNYIISFVYPKIPTQDLGDGFIRSTAIMGGGGPSIHLDKSTGKIVSWGLQK